MRLVVFITCDFEVTSLANNDASIIHPSSNYEEDAPESTEISFARGQEGLALDFVIHQRPNKRADEKQLDSFCDQSSSSYHPDHEAKLQYVDADNQHNLTCSPVHASALVEEPRSSASVGGLKADADQARSMKQAPYLKPLKSIFKKPRDQGLAFPSLPYLIDIDCSRVGAAND
ncbi:hypothetical protein Nepgr_026566 [Nepenthes gracilis]|uniref:Uncharacterized protein n=1 Tax=Nepenthes gracilis TaxID=150966 RepID=A0AAD3T7D7_NEPGR|nr:hypothetical protein Nepgr_026566 [Nepenthes gracilis]